MLSALGKISQISETEKVYKRLVIATNIPYKTKLLKFNVWDETKLQHKTGTFQVGDTVRVNYHHEKFLKLVSVKSTNIDYCGVCYSYFEEERDRQKIDCGNCSLIPNDERKERVDAYLKLTSNNLKDFQYSKGRCLGFVHELTGEKYGSVIYENQPLFLKTNNLELKIYNVVGWTNNKFDHFIDIVDIY